jgi:hypothetical protein
MVVASNRKVTGQIAYVVLRGPLNLAIASGLMGEDWCLSGVQIYLPWKLIVLSYSVKKHGAANFSNKLSIATASWWSSWKNVDSASSAAHGYTHKSCRPLTWQLSGQWMSRPVDQPQMGAPTGRSAIPILVSTGGWRRTITDQVVLIDFTNFHLFIFFLFHANERWYSVCS